MPIEPWWETNPATTPRQELGMVSPELLRRSYRPGGEPGCRQPPRGPPQPRLCPPGPRRSPALAARLRLTEEDLADAEAQSQGLAGKVGSGEAERQRGRMSRDPSADHPISLAGGDRRRNRWPISSSHFSCGSPYGRRSRKGDEEQKRGRSYNQ